MHISVAGCAISSPLEIEQFRLNRRGDGEGLEQFTRACRLLSLTSETDFSGVWGIIGVKLSSRAVLQQPLSHLL